MRRILVSTFVLCAIAMPALADFGTSILVSDNYAGFFGQGDVLKYDASSGAFEGVFIDLPQGNAGDLLYGPDGNLYLGVSAEPGSRLIKKYDGATGAFISEFSTGPHFSAFLTFGPDGDVYSTDFSGDRVHRFDPDTGTYVGEFITSQSGGLNGPSGLVFGPDDNLYVSSRITGQVLRYNGSTGAFMGVFATPGGNGPQDLQFGPDGNLWVARANAGRIFRYNPTTGSQISSWAVPGNSTDGMSMAFSPDNNYVLVSNANSSAVRRLNATTGADLGDFVAESSGGLIYPVSIVYFPAVPEPAVLMPLSAALLLLRRSRQSSS